LISRAGVFVAVAFGLAALGWVAAGLVVMALGAQELDLPARAAGVFLALSGGEWALSKMSRHASGS
jgi:hypothetical protein